MAYAALFLPKNIKRRFGMTGPIIMCNTTRNQSVVSSSDNFPVWRRSKDWHISVIALFENQPSEEIY